MSEQAIIFYAAKFFGHLTAAMGQACIRAVLASRPPQATLVNFAPERRYTFRHVLSADGTWRTVHHA